MQNWPRCERLAYEREREKTCYTMEGKVNVLLPSSKYGILNDLELAIDVHLPGFRLIFDGAEFLTFETKCLGG